MPKDPATLSDPVSIRLPADLLGDIDRIAEDCDQPRSWIIVRALQQYRAVEGADVLAAKEGLDQFNRSEFVEADAVLAEMDQIIDSDEAA